MNKRIKELAKQSGLVFINGGYQGERWYNSTCGMNESELEKFAELIIKECAEVMNQNDFEGSHIGDVILTHFGVE